MRVSDLAATSALTNNLRRTNFRLNQLQNMLATGTRINDPSDDPSAAERSLLLRSDIRNTEQYQRNIDEGVGFMDYVDSTLDDLVGTLIRIRGLAIQGASDTVNPGDRAIIASEVNELLEHVISQAQAKYRGRSVFAGVETLETPYSEVRGTDGDVISIGNTLRRSVGLESRTTEVGTLLGLTSPPSGTVTIGDQTVAIDLATDSLDDIKSNIEAAAPTGVSVEIEETADEGSTIYRLRIRGTSTAVDDNNVLGTLGIDNVDTTGAIVREVAEGVQIQVNIPGRDLFEGAQSVFTAFLGLRDSLRDNDVEGIRQSITDIEATREKISDTRGVLGARTNRIELMRSLQERFEVNLNKALGDAEDTDLTNTIIDLQAEQQTFQAALASSATIFQPTLMQFLV